MLIKADYKTEKLSMIKIIVIGLLLILVSACSQKAVYGDIQRNQRYQCLTLPDSEQGPCLASVDMSYEEYERQRTELNEKGIDK